MMQRTAAARVSPEMVDAQTTGVPLVPIADFLENLARVLPKLIEFVDSHELREHPMWGTAIPYAVPHFGTGRSRGHCVRPDVLLTKDGCRICELDFVPSGRGDMLSCLSRGEQDEVLDVFADWYRSMGVRRVLYATASTTVCRNETDLFAILLRRHDIDIYAANIDDVVTTDLEECFVDRLFYRSEMSMVEERKLLRGLNVSTAEPFLDSKVLFAMVHDLSLTRTLENALGADDLAFLREVLPQTRLLSSFSEKERDKLADEREKWVLKNTAVEIDDHWGSRGVVVGSKYTRKKFLEALKGSDPNGKKMGTGPIMQRWCRSRDFWQTWNGAVHGRYRQCRIPQVGGPPDEITFATASKHVGARIGFYFLVCRESRRCTVTPYGDMRLRQDELVHGARDAISLAVRAH